jgi:hypothetical protein
MMPNYDIAELCYGCFKLPILRAALRSSGVLVHNRNLLAALTLLMQVMDDIDVLKGLPETATNSALPNTRAR